MKFFCQSKSYHSTVKGDGIESVVYENVNFTGVQGSNAPGPGNVNLIVPQSVAQKFVNGMAYTLTEIGNI